MDEIKSWAFSVCAAAICGAILNMILPEGSAQKTYKAVFCVFFLCVLIAPFSELNIPDFESISNNISSFENENISDTAFAESSASIIEKAILEDTAVILSEHGIHEKDILIKINISENGSIDINKFVLTVCHAEDQAAVKEKIYQKTGIMPEIIISEENINGNIK